MVKPNHGLEFRQFPIPVITIRKILVFLTHDGKSKIIKFLKYGL